MTKADLLRSIIEACRAEDGPADAGRLLRVRRSPAAGGGITPALPATVKGRRATLQDPQTGARVGSRRRRGARRR